MNMIIGVTHDADGRVVQRLSVSTKIAIGLPPNGDRNYPTKLDHFVFLRKKRTAKGVEWEVDPELTKHYGNDCRKVRIVLIDDDVENVFPTSYAWWTTVERRCWGDGALAMRRTPEKPSGQPWKPCGNACSELASGLCKPSGDLRFVLADFPRLGSVCRIHTSSYRSIRQIHSALQEIQSFTGGRLAGLTAKLVVRPEEAAYLDPKDKRRKSTTIWALSLEVDGRDMKKLVASLTENARVFVETRKLLAGGRVLEVVQDETDQASELAAEFYSVTHGAPASSEKPNVTGQTAESKSGLPPSVEKVTGNTVAGGTTNAGTPASPSTDDRQPPQTPLWELEPNPTPPASPMTLPTPWNHRSSEPPAQPPKPNGETKGSATAPKARTLHGIVGPLEPDTTGKTVRRTDQGVEYVVFKVAQNGSAATVFCKQPELLPELARRQGRQGTVQVTVAGKNGHAYYVLEGFVEG